MKKVILFIFLVFLLVPTAYAFFDYNFLTGKTALNNPPQISSGYPSNTHVINKMYFTWKYEDKEGDEQELYLLQIDKDFRFFDAINIYGTKGTSTEVKLKFDSGEYCWRVKSKDAYNWGDWSETKCFVLDTSKKTCGDGTPFWECSSSIPLYCDGGTLKEDCKRCGCDINEVCKPTGICVKKTCADYTTYGKCSTLKPKYCQAGDLINLCSLCGCPSGTVCQSDGACSAEAILITQAKEETPPRTLLEIIAEFFKGLIQKIR